MSIFSNENHKSFQSEKAALPYLLPALSLIFVFCLYPLLDLVYLSFFRWNGLSATKEFISSANYLALLSSSDFYSIIGNTLIFALMTVPPSIIIALCLALLIQKNIRHRSFFRSAFFLPVIISTVGAALAWKFIYNADAGILNRILGYLSLSQPRWLGDENTALWAVALTTIWKNAGYNMVLFLAGLYAISPVYYEAAAVDGIEKSWIVFRRITLPLLRPTILLVTVISVIFSFKSFDQIHVMTHGGPVGATTVLIYHIYEKGFVDFEMGMAAAVSVVMLVAVLALTWLQIKIGGVER